MSPLLLVAAAFALEGMWLPAQLPDQAPALRSAGFSGDPAALADLNGAPLGAVVSLGGCTATFVSDSGLLITNHHCVTGMLQRAQKEGENLEETGFYAATRADERPGGAGARVWITQSIEDVTAKVVGALPPKLSDRARNDAIDAASKRLVAACERTPGTRCRVASYYEGLQYSLIRQLELRDVRVVMAPPDMVGNYGDEVDNWHWPRHAGDFGFLRAYVGKDGKPADYSPENVPYTPPQHVTVAPRGPEPGEFVMVAGYPGRTQRWRTALEVEREATLRIPSVLEHGGWVLQTLQDRITAEPALAAKLTVPRLGLGNSVFKNKGMLEGFARAGAVEHARTRDAGLDAWIAADPARAAKWAAPIAELRAVITRHDATRLADERMDWLGRSTLLSAARSLYLWSREQQKPDTLRELGFQDRDAPRTKAWLADLDASLEPGTERVVFEHFLRLVLALPVEQQPPELVAWLAQSPGATADVDGTAAAAVTRLYGAPTLTDKATRLALLGKKPAIFEASHDGFVSLAVALSAYDERRRDADKADQGAFSRLRPAYADALRTFDPARAYPDANSTLRVSFGTVQGYQPRDAVTYTPQTTVRGIVEKAGAWPFAAPPPLLAAIQAGQWGAWADPALGTVPVDFLSDLDITGGNSGSATLDAQGRLVGLVFDSNYEGIGSDWLHEATMARSVHVDVRYVLWYLDAVAGADSLLREMGIQPSVG